MLQRKVTAEEKEPSHRFFGVCHAVWEENQWSNRTVELALASYIGR